MFDKILLAALLLLLPITIVITSFYSNKSSQTTVSQENLTKVTLLLDQLQQKIKQNPVEVSKPEINISTVYFATDSGELIFSGIAPKQDLSLQVSIVEKKTLASSEATNSAVLGDSVDVKALTVGSEGMFKYIYEINKPKEMDKLEVRFEQGSASKTVLYNFKKGTFEQY